MWRAACACGGVQRPPALQVADSGRDGGVRDIAYPANRYASIYQVPNLRSTLLTLALLKCTIETLEQFDAQHRIFLSGKIIEPVQGSSIWRNNVTEYTTAEARNQFSEVINKAAYGKERVRLSRRGKVIAVVVPVEDIEVLEKLEDRLDARDVKAAIRQGETAGTISLDAFLDELNLEKQSVRKKTRIRRSS